MTNQRYNDNHKDNEKNIPFLLLIISIWYIYEWIINSFLFEKNIPVIFDCIGVIFIAILGIQGCITCTKNI